ncbi:MAG: ABC transporter permease [Oscillospiraceae bacterium]|nr:ABC transporter permease [Oscillospiraceae bacterium]
MSAYLSLTKRNCLIFLRDKGAVIMSMLSMAIVLLLMGVFLGDMNVEEITDLLKKYGGARDEEADLLNAKILVHYWTLAGITVVNAVMASLTVMGQMISDNSENRLAGFYCAPVSKGIIALSYITASVIIGTLMCLAVAAAYIAYITAIGGSIPPVSDMISAALYTLMTVFIFSLIMYLAAMFVRSTGVWSGIGTVVGTLAGFAGAIYLPMGSLADGAAAVLKFIPILHGTSLLRRSFCGAIMEKTFEGLPEGVLEGYEDFMGITVKIGDNTLSDMSQILFISLFGLAALIAILLISRKRRASDR